MRSGLGGRDEKGRGVGIAARQGGWLGEKWGGGRIEAAKREVACEQEQE